MESGSGTGLGSETGPGTGLGGPKHRNENTFTSENNPKGKKKVLPEEPDGQTEAGRMRLVWGQPKDRDCNSEQRNLRLLLERSASDYRRMMREAELEEEAKARAATSEGGVVDEGEGRVRDLIAELLSESAAGVERLREDASD